MAQRIRYLCIGTLVAMFLVLPLGINHAHGDEGHSGGDTTSGSVLGFEGQHRPVWRLQGGNPFLIGGYGDNFSHDGSSVTPLIGKAKVVLDAEKNTGTARFTVFGTVNPEKGKTYTGEITLHYRVGSGGPAFQEGGVADFVYLHGDTGQDAPVMPKIRTFLGSWGSADVFINGELVYPNLMAHIMYTERGRDPVTQTVHKGDGKSIYDPKTPADGSVVDPNGRELHFVAHNMKEDKGNFPPHKVWIHLNFESVRDGAGSGY
jgi:hypothetical protein